MLPERERQQEVKRRIPNWEPPVEDTEVREPTAADEIREWQHHAGNRAVSALLGAQPKLRVTAAGDASEREADAVAGKADGQKLLAHELTHTVQQGAASVSRQEEEAPGAEAEEEEASGDLSGVVEDEQEEDETEVHKGPDDKRDRGPRRKVTTEP